MQSVAYNNLLLLNNLQNLIAKTNVASKNKALQCTTSAFLLDLTFLTFWQTHRTHCCKLQQQLPFYLNFELNYKKMDFIWKLHSNSTCRCQKISWNALFVFCYFRAEAKFWFVMYLLINKIHEVASYFCWFLVEN